MVALVVIIETTIAVLKTTNKGTCLLRVYIIVDFDFERKGEIMRGYVFTKEEKKILNTYVKRGDKVRHFNVIMTLIRRNQKNLEDDLEILNAVTRRMKRSPNKRGRRRS